jgi:sugar phosphate isomerase/epimerase
MQELGLKFSAFDAHCTLLMPAVGIPYVAKAIDLAAELECPIVMSDEGPVPHEWMELDRAFDLMCLSIEQIVQHAATRRVRFAIELHNALTTRSRYLEKLLDRFGPEELGVNFDTGNSFLAGNDPVEMLELIAARVLHVHIKDIAEKDVPLRGTVTGTRVGVAAGDGVVDLAGVLAVLADGGYEGVLSIECDNLEQAIRSRQFLQNLIDNTDRQRHLALPPKPSNKFSAVLSEPHVEVRATGRLTE